jgi:hypothetical protein
MGEEESSSFLKKRTKKLLFFWPWSSDDWNVSAILQARADDAALWCRCRRCARRGGGLSWDAAEWDAVHAKVAARGLRFDQRGNDLFRSAVERVARLIS